MTYKEKLLEIIPKFEDEKLLERIYRLVVYLYVYKDGNEEDSKEADAEPEDEQTAE
jgi:hypothetical protein